MEVISIKDLTRLEFILGSKTIDATFNKLLGRSYSIIGLDFAELEMVIECLMSENKIHYIRSRLSTGQVITPCGLIAVHYSSEQKFTTYPNLVSCPICKRALEETNIP